VVVVLQPVSFVDQEAEFRQGQLQSLHDLLRIAGDSEDFKKLADNRDEVYAKQLEEVNQLLSHCGESQRRIEAQSKDLLISVDALTGEARSFSSKFSFIFGGNVPAADFEQFPRVPTSANAAISLWKSEQFRSRRKELVAALEVTWHPLGDVLSVTKVLLLIPRPCHIIMPFVAQVNYALTAHLKLVTLAQDIIFCYVAKLISPFFTRAKRFETERPSTKLSNSEWKLRNSEWKLSNSEWKLSNSEWKLSNSN
jgi:hypothetical protein